MKRLEAFVKGRELEVFIPIEPYGNEYEAELARQMQVRIDELYNYARTGNEPIPPDEWEPTVLMPSEKDKKRFIIQREKNVFDDWMFEFEALSSKLSGKN